MNQPDLLRAVLEIADMVAHVSGEAAAQDNPLVVASVLNIAEASLRHAAELLAAEDGLGEA